MRDEAVIVILPDSNDANGSGQSIATVRLAYFSEWSSAKVSVEALTEDRDGLEPGQICASRNYIILVALIAFKRPQINTLDILLEEVFVVLRVRGSDQE